MSIARKSRLGYKIGEEVVMFVNPRTDSEI